MKHQSWQRNWDRLAHRVVKIPAKHGLRSGFGSGGRVSGGRGGGNDGAGRRRPRTNELISSLANIECKSDTHSVEDSVEPVAAVEVETQESLEPASEICMSLVLCRGSHGLTDGDRTAVVDGTSAVCNLNRHRSARSSVDGPSKRSARLLPEILQSGGRSLTTGNDGKVVRSW